jgi:hypothetical protein
MRHARGQPTIKEEEEEEEEEEGREKAMNEVDAGRDCATPA